MLKTGAAAAGAALTGGPFQGLLAESASAKPGHHPRFDLVPALDRRDGQVRLHLPRGFSYRSFHDTELPVTLGDGTLLPGRHDGMGAFPGPHGNIRLVRNHEITNSATATAFGPGAPYDANAGAGCTTVEVTKYGEVVDSYTSLNGTMFNCSGGVMPWGSWITCEETINGPDVGPDFQGVPNTHLEEKHGYIFEVPADGQSNRQPITRAGRFPHEAVSFDPVDGILYLTEDNFEFPSGFYRYIPKHHPMDTGFLDNEGRLQMLAVKGRPLAHLEARQQRRATYKVEWVDIDDPDPTMPAGTTNDQALVKVGDQGRAQGAALFSRLEGQVYEDHVVYFTSTQGGGPAEQDWGAADDDDDNASGFGKGNGQVWAYHCRSKTLQVVYQAPVDDTEANLRFDFPDNITTSKRGTLVVCEDSAVDNYIRGLSRGGQLWDIALNRLVSQVSTDPVTGEYRQRYADEFAGSTFSPGGHTLFVNIQASAGMTFAIWGPWRKIGV
ncbi:PhoX family protein [Nocardioides caricicola]|uniref:PhoX family protein n=1 Tax=Nocardioides caricicola TaxID=634770 RepID=A0ABW0N795_9ACTN